jgi:acid phosphatase type 7
VGGPIDDRGPVPALSWVEYDVTPIVRGDGTYSFRLATASSDGIDFRSRNASTTHPELVLTVSPGGSSVLASTRTLSLPR